MRIAYLINSLEGGGAALPVPAIARVLRGEGAEVAVLALTRRNGRAMEPMQAAGLRVLVRDGGERDHLRAFRWLDRTVSDGDFDLLWTSLTRATLLGQLVGRRRGVPVVSWQHNAFLKPANRRLLRLTQGLSRLWVADSETVARLTAERLRVPPSRLLCWPIFGADADAPQAAPWQPGEPVRIGSLGRLHPAKGYDVLIAALARLRDAGHVPFTVTLFGEGAARDALQAQADAAGLGAALRFAGFTQRSHDALAGLHLYVQPSRAEGFCVAAHEAMQAALPVVASRVGEMAHTLADRRGGQLVPPGDPEALAGALQTLLANPSQLAAIGQAARQQVLERFNQARFEAAGRAAMDRVRAVSGG